MAEEKPITKSDLKETLREVIEESYGGQKFKDSVENIFEGQGFKKAVTGIMGEFTDDVLLPALGRLIDDSANSVKKELREEIKTSEQASRDWTSKKVDELKGELVLPLKRENDKVEKITDKLCNKKIFDSKDIEEIKSIEVFAKVA